MESFGAPADIIEALKAEDEAVDFEVDPDNWDIVMFFMRVQTQWRAGYAGPTGLDYTAVESTFRMLEIEDRREIFEGLQIMEAAALKVFSKG